jgi:predicted RNA-binding Zn-ribbon protein involved in translation (DUF1610 family)
MTTATPIRHPAKTVLYKSCPRCHGDLVIDRESEAAPEAQSVDFVCLQCGRSVSMKMVEFPAVAPRQRVAA